MSEFNEEFLFAFNHAMLYEVGAFWNPNDQVVIDGLCDTKENRRKVGYVNDPNDAGGETKYGVAVNANPDISIKDLNLEGAMQIYFDRYWIAGHCDKIPFPVSIIHFDGCVNHGIGRANKFLQTAVSVTADGQVGPATLAAVESGNSADIINSISQQRNAFYNNIVAKKPVQARFLGGWLRRIKEVTDFTLSKV